MEPNSQHVGSDYAEGLISNLRTVNPKNPPKGDNLPGTAQPVSLGHRVQQALRGGFHREPSGPHSPPSGTISSLVANRRPFLWISVALMAALAVSLLLMWTGEFLQAQDACLGADFCYEENGTDTVATFTALDPEGASVTWYFQTAALDRSIPLTLTRLTLKISA